jgi:hypothetical protein
VTIDVIGLHSAHQASHRLSKQALLQITFTHISNY